jgi:hypothetical protein
MFRFNCTDDQISGLIDSSGWEFQQAEIVPKPLGFNEIDTVFFEIGMALGFVELKHGIKSIPFCNLARNSP